MSCSIRGECDKKYNLGKINERTLPLLSIKTPKVSYCEMEKK